MIGHFFHLAAPSEVLTLSSTAVGIKLKVWI